MALVDLKKPGVVRVERRPGSALPIREANSKSLRSIINAPPDFSERPAVAGRERIGLYPKKAPGTEITDPGIPLAASTDRYIPPESQETALPQRTPQTWKPLRWVQSILARKRITEEAIELIAKAQRLSLAPDISIRYFFDNDLPRLVSLSRLQPALIQKMLREKETNDPWFRLVQVACGDAGAVLPALDSLC